MHESPVKCMKIGRSCTVCVCVCFVCVCVCGVCVCVSVCERESTVYVSRQQSAQNPEHLSLSLEILLGIWRLAKVIFNHLIHFPCMLSYRPKVKRKCKWRFQ